MTEADARAYVPAPDLLKDRVVLITGASGGIGAELARASASRGARVVLSGRNVKKLEAVYDSILEAGGLRPSIAPLDFERADASHYAALSNSVREEFGRLDGLVHLAGQLGERAPIEHHDVVTWLRVMHVNVNAAFILTQALLPLLRASSDASVIFTSSGVAQKPGAYWGAYAVSKVALEGLMLVLADETESLTRIRVNSVNPGKVRTAMRARAFPGEVAGSVPVPGLVTPTYLYLLGPDSRGVTGRRFEAQ